MKYRELKDRPRAELELFLKTEREKLRDIRFKISAKQQKNVREIRLIKKTIARILTILKQAKGKTNEPRKEE